MPAKINIVNEKGEKLEAETEGYLLVYADGERMRLAGSINLRLFAPLLSIAVTYLSEKLKELEKLGTRGTPEESSAVPKGR